MKKKNITLLLIASLFIFPRCQDELAKDFINPGVYTPTSDIPAGMFTSMMTRRQTFINIYNESWHHILRSGIIGHTQLTSYFLYSGYKNSFDGINSPSTYNKINNIDTYFNGPNFDFRELPLMEERVASMPDAEKANNEIYVTLSKMVRGYRASKAVDLLNSIPYSEALKAHEGLYFPKYDNPLDIYKTIIHDLDTYADLAVQQEANLSSDGKRVFKEQDVIFDGDINKWQQFANAVRLRMAVRLSGVQEDYAKEVISEILSKGNLPTEDLMIAARDWVSKQGTQWKQGFRERSFLIFVSPALMYKLDRDMDHHYTEGTDDPRLPVLFLPNRDTLYMPVSLDFSVGDVIYDSIKARNIREHNFEGVFTNSGFNSIDPYMKRNACSVWSPTTMVRNQAPWRAFTRAEVDLLLAEVAMKGLGNTGKSAAEHLKDGIISSTNYWYYVNSFAMWEGQIDNNNKSFLTPTKPDQSVIDQFASSIADEYNSAAGDEERMSMIMWQKYIHLNIHDYLEVHCELRRTRHPKLPLIKVSDDLIVSPHVERYPYPGKEYATNPDEVLKVMDQDNFTTPVFWVPEHLKGVSYYEDSFNEDYFYIEYPSIPGTYSGN